MIFLTLTLFLSTGGANADLATTTFTPEAEAENVTRVYDLAPLTVRVMPHQRTQSFVPLIQDPSMGSGGYFDSEARSVFSSGEVMEMLYEQLDEQFEYEDRRLWQLEDGRVGVRGPEAVHAEVQGVLGFLGDLSASHAELTVDVLVTKSKGFASPEMTGLVPLDAAEAWLMRGAAAAQRSRFRTQLTPGSVGGFDSTRSLPAVLDWDVEIAQGSAVHDPLTASIRVGRQLRVMGAPTGDGLLLAMSLVQGELAEPPTSRANRHRILLGSEGGHQFLDGPANTQYVRLANRSLSCNTALGDDQALVLRFDLAAEGGEGLHEVIVIRRTGGDLPVSRRMSGVAGNEFVALDSSALTPPRVRSEQMESHSRLLAPWSNLGALDIRNDEPAAFAHLRSQDADSAAMAIQEQLDMDGIYTHGAWLFLLPQIEADADGNPPATDIDALIRAMRPAVRNANVTIELRRGGPEGELLRRAGFAARTGEESMLSLGMERSYEYGYDVEVAQHAGVADAETRVAFDGLFCRLRLDALPDGGMRLHLEGVATSEVASRRFDYEGPLLERAHQPELAMLSLNDTVRMASGETERRFVLGNQLTGGGSDDLTVVLHVAR